jgi:methionyl-tRNA synthetase
MSQKPFYITTTLPYVNAPIHLGHATEIIRADAIARYKKLIGYEVFFNTGTDEHGMKIYESAKRADKPVQQHVDEYAALYKQTLEKFGVSADAHYIRTTDPHHVAAAQEFWKRCDKNGHIYKKKYQTKYCIGCEEEKTDSELVDGKCPEHNTVPEIIDEENYFFKLSSFGDKLLALYDSNPQFVIPSYRLNELREFVKRGLNDFSISRLKEKMSWGIPVPGDPDQVMYVWFDALVNYISTLGWPEEGGDFNTFWVKGTPTQYCGKNNTRFQGLMWQAMLMSAQVPPTHTIVVDGFILGGDGLKMSKTLGNVIDPVEVVEKFGVDALRYFVLREFHPFEDSDVSEQKLTEAFNSHLANGLGNLTSRILKMSSTNLDAPVEIPPNTILDDYKKSFDIYDIQEAANVVWKYIAEADALIQKTEPFKLVKTDKAAAVEIIKDLCLRLYTIARMLNPIMPQTSEAIKKLVKENKMPETALFMRK